MVSELQSIDRVEEIITSLQNGVTREKLAAQFEHRDYRSLDMYMRRRGYTWNAEFQNYMRKDAKIDSVDAQIVHSGRVLQVLELFERGSDAKYVAKQLAFPNHRSLAEYMKSKKYAWNQEVGNYESVKGMKKEDGGVQEESIEFLNKYADTVPRYLIPGVPTSKNINMSHLLNQLVIEFSHDRNIKQREIFETAVINFLQQYGYAHEIKALFQK